jgi:hypothetical protein
VHHRRVVFAHACKLGAEGIVSKRLGSKFKNRAALAVRREAVSKIVAGTASGAFTPLRQAADGI